MKTIQLLNSISPLAAETMGPAYSLVNEAAAPDGILVRSFKMHEMALPETCLAIARAGAGTNNIPVEDYAKQGVVVFNTPGANANAVKELAIAALLLGGRRIHDAMEWVETLDGDDVEKRVEKEKSRFAGHELSGRRLGVVGLGAIGALVANAALGLDMEVIGYDPYLSVEHALSISRHITRVENLDDLIRTCDFITLHVPLTADSRGMVNEEMISHMKDGVVLVNCARGELVDRDAILAATASEKVARYITDFPSAPLINQKNIVCLPHLGASTPEAEDNCAVMAARQLRDYLENGNIVNSVNYPACASPRQGAVRLTIHHANRQSMIAQITAQLAALNVNIENLVNKSRGEYAYTMIDTNQPLPENALEAIRAIEGVIRVRQIA